MAKTNSAIRMIEKMVGDDTELRHWIADARASSQIAEMVYDARSAAGLTQKQLADLIDTGQSAIARLEDADYDGHSLSTLQRIAEVLNCHIELSIVPNRPTSQHA